MLDGTGNTIEQEAFLSITNLFLILPKPESFLISITWWSDPLWFLFMVAVEVSESHLTL
jgi:hypothetical protein